MPNGFRTAALLLAPVIGATIGAVSLNSSQNSIVLGACGLALLLALLINRRLSLSCWLGLGVALGALAMAGVRMSELFPFGVLDQSPREWLGFIGGGVVIFASALLIGVARKRALWLGLLAALPSGIALYLGATGLSTHFTPIKRTSVYVEMRDGVKIATDAILPRGIPATEKRPTIFMQSRYQRATRYHFPFNLVMGGTRSASIKRYLANGYAYVVIDVRGSGASFGVRNSEFSADEVKDGVEIVNWIVRQPWSNGVVGAEGISYGGTAAELLLAQAHPAVKAIAINFSLYESYLDIAYPGGSRNIGFVRQWAQMNRMLDTGKLDPAIAPAMARLAWAGVMPVDSDWNGALLKAALALRPQNYAIVAAGEKIEFRDQAEDPTRLGVSVAPYRLQQAIRDNGKPMLMISGWLDGGYQNAAIKRFLTSPTPGSQLVIGPWDHGAFSAISPCKEEAAEESRRSWWRYRLAFFDHYLRGIDNGVNKEPAVRYFQMCGDGWKSANQWPIPSTSTIAFFAAPNGVLADNAPAQAGAQSYRVDPEVSSGPGSRWMSLAQNLLAPFPIGYPDRAAQNAKMMTFTSAPLPQPLSITGHAGIAIDLGSDQPDGAIFVYLEDVSPKGEVRYITEGLLRLVNRAPLAPEKAPYVGVGVQHSFLKADALPMPVNSAPARVEISMLPISYRLNAGHRLRLSIAGADKGNFQPLSGPVPLYTLQFGPAMPPTLILPVETE